MVEKTGRLNLITDVKGLKVGNASDEKLKSGVTVVMCDEPAVASVKVLGGAPGTRETDLLEPHTTVERAHAICLSGGSAFGLDAASGVQAYLREKNIGFQVGPHRVPIVPSAILFDLMNGGDKDWGQYSPYREMGYLAATSISDEFKLGTTGAGTGALTAKIKGGLGSASAIVEDYTIGALAAVNPMGSATMGKSKHFWAAPFEIKNEFGGLGLPQPMPEDVNEISLKFRDLERGSSDSGAANTTITVIATDAVLDKAQAKRLAISAHDGLARAIWPCHTPSDGDLVFALATGTSGKVPDHAEFTDLCASAASTMARAIARGVYAAEPCEGDVMPCWSQI